MKYKDFRNYRIIRSSSVQYSNHMKYLKDLSKDFKHRCAYCNMLDTLIAQSFEVDHFIPRDVFKDTKRKSLETDYNNLIYSCPKCNRAKWNKYAGDLNDGTYNNLYFYNPVDEDYNKFFYRNEYGGISSEDRKGKEMILNLRLYSPIYNISFLLEQIDTLIKKVDSKIDNIVDETEKYKYSEVSRQLYKYYRNLLSLFNCYYYKNSAKYHED